MVGVATTTRRAMPSSSSAGSASTAAPTNASPGMNMTTSSGARRELLPVRLARQRRHVLPHLRRRGARSRRHAPPAWPRRCASRYAASGTLASTTISRPPGRCTTMSGRRRPPLALDGDLLAVVAVLGQAGQLDHAVQRDLAPPPAHVGGAQRGGQADPSRAAGRRARPPASAAAPRGCRRRAGAWPPAPARAPRSGVSASCSGRTAASIASCATAELARGHLEEARLVLPEGIG